MQVVVTVHRTAGPQVGVYRYVDLQRQKHTDVYRHRCCTRMCYKKTVGSDCGAIIRQDSVVKLKYDVSLTGT